MTVIKLWTPTIGCGRPSEPLDGPPGAGIGGGAAELGMWLIPGSVPELGDGGRVYNTQVVFDPTGNLVAS